MESSGPNNRRLCLLNHSRKVFAVGLISLLILPTSFGITSPFIDFANPVQEANAQPAGPDFVSDPVTPVVLNIDLSTLPTASPSRLGDPVKETPGPLGERPMARSPETSGNGSNTGKATAVPVQQPSLASPALGAFSPPVVDFEGLAFSTFVPSDDNGDVGPNHYIQMVNAQFQIFDKLGNSLAGPLNNNQLWIAANTNDACENNNDGDPIVQYDHLADRWLLSQFVAFTHECIAISQTPDPVAGGWFLYTFPSPVFNDYPKFGVWPDAYYMGSNDGYPGGDAWAFDRANMLLGNAATFQIFNIDPNGGLFLPSDLDGPPPPPGTPNFFVRFVEGGEFGGVDRVELMEFSVDFANPGLSTFTALPDLATAPFDSNLCGAFGISTICVPQPVTDQLLDNLRGFTMYRAPYRDFGTHESIVINHTVDVDGTDRHGIKWYELRRVGGVWSIFQEGTYSPDGTHRWMGSIAMDKFGNIALGYSVSSDTVNPSIRYVGRLATDPLGTLPQGEFQLIGGTGVQPPLTCAGNPCGHRWGDYTSMMVDPVDDCTFWYTNQYTSPPPIWQTRVGAFRYDNCTEISGTKFNDLNANGVRDIGEPGLAGWTIRLSGAAVASTITDANGNYRFIDLQPGAYQVCEEISLQPGFIQTAPAAGPACIGPFEAPIGHAIQLQDGQKATGNDFGNVLHGIIVITKDSIPDDPQDFTFNANIQLAFPLPPVISITLDDDPTSPAPLNVEAISPVVPGTYFVTEIVPPGFVLTAIVCQDPSGGTTIDLATATANIDVAPGEIVACTYTDVKLGTIIINKDTQPSPHAQDFTYLSNRPAIIPTFSLDDDNDPTLPSTITFDNLLPNILLPGPYVIREIPNIDFLTTVRCVEDQVANTSTAGLRAIIELDPGETVECTFTNALDIVKTIHAEKEILVDLTSGIVKEVTIYIEIHENLNRLRPGVPLQDPVVLKQVEVVTCEKKIDEAKVLSCETSTPPEDEGLIDGIQNCTDEPITFTPQMNTVSKSSASDSGGMNTVISGLRHAVVKTIDAQKEVFVCEQGTKIQDVIIFTEIFENLNSLPRNPIILKQFEVVTCLKDAATLTVESCVFGPTTRIFP